MMKTFCSPSMVMANSLESRCQSRCQVVVRVVVKGLLSVGFCQSGCCQSGCCHRASVRGFLSKWPLSESKSATKLLYLSVLVIYTARNHSERQNYVIIRSDPKPSTANPEFQTRSHQSYPGDPNNPGNPRTNTEGKQGQTQKWKVEKNHELTNIHYIVILTNHSRP